MKPNWDHGQRSHRVGAVVGCGCASSPDDPVDGVCQAADKTLGDGIVALFAGAGERVVGEWPGILVRAHDLGRGWAFAL